VTSPFTIVGAFAFGLIASGHCLLMCGGIAGALGAVTTRRTDAGTPWLLLSGYQLGRITSYAVAGVLIGSIGAGIVQFVDQESVRIALRWLTALVFAALALNLLRSGRGFDFALGHSIWARLAPFARRFVPVRTLPRAFALGALWGWMPCGLVYSVLIVAALGANPLQSGAIMFAFGLGTVPAVLAVTREPFLVYTSNIFAMLGLRSLYFVLAGIIDRFRYIRVGLAVILMFFGARLLLGDVVEFPNWVPLLVIVVVIGLSVVASLKWPGPARPAESRAS